VGRPWDGRWLGLGHLLVKCAQAHSPENPRGINISLSPRASYVSGVSWHSTRVFFDFISPTHKRTEGRAPVWGSEFTTKDVPEGEFSEIIP
jgi:hypothetical protein